MPSIPPQAGKPLSEEHRAAVRAGLARNPRGKSTLTPVQRLLRRWEVERKLGRTFKNKVSATPAEMREAKRIWEGRLL